MGVMRKGSPEKKAGPFLRRRLQTLTCISAVAYALVLFISSWQKGGSWQKGRVSGGGGTAFGGEGSGDRTVARVGGALGSGPQQLNAASLPPAKPWTLGSLRVWPPATATCDALFGNGFTEDNVIWPEPVEGKRVHGSLHCLRNPSTSISLCHGRRLAMRPSRIVSARGGEQVEMVMGQEEDKEMPEFQEGAFVLEAGVKGESQRVFSDATARTATFMSAEHPEFKHIWRKLYWAMTTVPFLNCSQVVTTPTLFVARYEYANLFHTSSDWFSAYTAAKVLGLGERPHVVFVDGHPSSSLDPAWSAMFSSATHAKAWGAEEVCFEHAVFVPLGYSNIIFDGVQTANTCEEASQLPSEFRPLRPLVAGQNNKPMGHWLSEFGQFVAAATLGAGAGGASPATRGPSDPIKVLFVRREDYVAHPRHTGRVEVRLSNEVEVVEALRVWAQGRSSGQRAGVKIREGPFGHLTFHEQVEMVREADIIIGAHGAGLTHLLFARPRTVIIELAATKVQSRPHFGLMSGWRGDLGYKLIALEGSHANPPVVVEEVERVVVTLENLPS